jgi:hypothetical protein
MNNASYLQEWSSCSLFTTNLQSRKIFNPALRAQGRTRCHDFWPQPRSLPPGAKPKYLNFQRLWPHIRHLGIAGQKADELGLPMGSGLLENVCEVGFGCPIRYSASACGRLTAIAF